MDTWASLRVIPSGSRTNHLHTPWGVPIRYVVVIDGEHYPPVTEAAIEELRSSGKEVVGAVLVGGKEKLKKGDLKDLAGLEVTTVGSDPRRAFEEALRQHQPDAVFDLSDEPVLDYRKRHELASIALSLEVRYEGADFTFEPLGRERLCTKPSLAVIGTGKRTGKTAVSGAIARTLKEDGRGAVIVAMGRGGPPEPEVLRGDEVDLRPRDLLQLADSGKHAASDYIEDALLGRVPAVGCRRCGGGLGGKVGISNVPEGVALANDLPGDIILLEGSGSAVPPAQADVTALVMPASVPLEYLRGYLGPLRLLLSDYVVITMCEEPFGSPSQISEILSAVRDSYRTSGKEEIRVVRTVFRPLPTADVAGKKVFVATTAPKEAADSMRSHLQESFDCEVVGFTHSLSDREVLEEEIAKMSDTADTLLCEIKAAGIDVATRRALEHDLDVVYMDNAPVGIDGEDPDETYRWAADLAAERFGA